MVNTLLNSLICIDSNLNHLFPFIRKRFSGFLRLGEGARGKHGHIPVTPEAPSVPLRSYLISNASMCGLIAPTNESLELRRCGAIFRFSGSRGPGGSINHISVSLGLFPFVTISNPTHLCVE